MKQFLSDYMTEDLKAKLLQKTLTCYKFRIFTLKIIFLLSIYFLSYIPPISSSLHPSFSTPRPSSIVTYSLRLPTPTPPALLRQPSIRPSWKPPMPRALLALTPLDKLSIHHLRLPHLPCKAILELPLPPATGEHLDFSQK